MHSYADPRSIVAPPLRPSKMTRVAGYAWMSVAIAIWASWLVLTSSGVTTDLSPVDLAGFRALVPAIALLPMLWRQRHEVAQIGFRKCLLLSAYGAPFTLCVGYGLSFAPVTHAGALVPGMMPVMASLIGLLFLGQRMSVPQTLSALLIVAGALAIVLKPTGSSDLAEIWRGHALFLMGAFFWSCFTLTVRHHAIPPFLATAIVASVSILGLAPIWGFSDLSSLATASLCDIAFQLVFQGVITGLISLYAFSQALRLIGPLATRLTALTPVVATCLAIPILSQAPGPFEVVALGVVFVGLLVAADTTKMARKTAPRPVPCN